MDKINNIRKTLLSLGDSEYKAFHSKLIPNVPTEKIIGIRTPVLRKYAKELCGSEEAYAFLRVLPHEYYEENNLHAFLIEQIKEYDRVIAELDRFLPYVDNWATCDMMSPKCFSENRNLLLKDVFRWIDSGQTYTVRFGVCMLMKYCLGENIRAEYIEKVANIKSDEYYVKMVIAWYFATALTKNYDIALPYIQNRMLDIWVHNKTIQKACESYQISKDKKEFLKTLKIK